MLHGTGAGPETVPLVAADDLHTCPLYGTVGRASHMTDVSP